ncbi:LytTR family DNA-binding domain-containing protein [Clostridium perfringens]|uniref:LytR/AlgR family response regulator transcription factor n=1 Tax=Clostridium perfringens TaxID=1502 RepID=UPI0030CEE1F4
MLNIAICDDEKFQCAIVKKMISKICAKNNMEISIDEFNSASELINIYNRNIKKYSIILCDIIMDEMNGIELIRRMRKIDSSFQAIIITGSNEYVFDGYDVGALNYLMKPIDSNKLEKEFLRAIKSLNYASPSTYTININGKISFIDLSSVLFFEVNNKTITANLENKNIDFSMKIKVLEEELEDKNFLRCHRSYLVNMSQVETILQNKIMLKNGNSIPIGRCYKKNLKKYILEMINGI